MHKYYSYAEYLENLFSMIRIRVTVRSFHLVEV